MTVASETIDRPDTGELSNEENALRAKAWLNQNNYQDVKDRAARIVDDADPAKGLDLLEDILTMLVDRDGLVAMDSYISEAMDSQSQRPIVRAAAMALDAIMGNPDHAWKLLAKIAALAAREHGSVEVSYALAKLEEKYRQVEQV